MNITRRAMQCWECGREAPGGVCTGPHEGYDHEAAKRRGYVLPLDGVGVPVLVFPGATWDPQRYYRANRDVRLARNKQYRFEQRLARERRLARLIERLGGEVSSSSAREVEQAFHQPGVAPTSLGAGERAGARETVGVG